MIAAQKNRRERLEQARKIEWLGLTDYYTTDLFCDALALLRWYENEALGTNAIWFANQCHNPTQTQVEDLIQLCRQSRERQQQEKASM